MIMAQQGRLRDMSAQTELARAVLQMLMAGDAVPTHHAIQLRNWAVCSGDSVLSLEEIARRILSRTRSMADASQVGDWRRVGAEFIIVDLELAFTFLKIARTSLVTETVWRNQKNARTAYNAVLRFLPRCLPALSAAEQQAIEDNLRKLKDRLEQLGECF
jgi:hypothetical protein